jgi:hypothetical protein
MSYSSHSAALQQMRSAAQTSGNAMFAASGAASGTGAAAAAAASAAAAPAPDAADGAAALSTLSMAPVVSRIEGHRVLAALQKAIERLKLLTLLDAEQLGKAAAAVERQVGVGASTGSSAAAAAAAAEKATAAAAAAAAAAGQGTGNGIAALLVEQSRLEQRYDALVAASKARQGRNPNEPVLDAQCFAHVADVDEQRRQQELHEVATALKAQSKMLCRLLKDNPCDADNWRKIVMERSELIALLEQCARELALSCQPPGAGSGAGASAGAGGLPGSFEMFAKKVLEDEAASAWADGLVRKERETNQNVKQLQNEVKTERAAKEADIEEKQRDISDLKSKLAKLSAEVKAQLEQLGARTKAASEAQQRASLNMQRVLREKIALLRMLVRDEAAVSTSFKGHTATRSERIDAVNADWSQKAQDAVKAMQNEKADREKAAQREADRLQTTRERCEAEALSAKARSELQRELDEEKRKREDLALARYAAATKVQAAIKAFFTRQVLIGLKKKAIKKNRRAAAAAAAGAAAANAPLAKPGRRQ